MDRDDSWRTSQTASGGPAYWFSYTANGYAQNNTLKGVVSSWAANPGVYTRQKLGNIRGPANKLMLVEEQASVSDSPPGKSPNLVDGRWASGGDSITTRHSKKGNANFADGHAEPVGYNFAADTNHIDVTIF